MLGIGAEAVGALLARARLRLHDELHGTALAAAAVRSPDCEDVLAAAGAASDGELGAAEPGWADPHVERCPTCPRTRRAMDEAAATYAAWSPAVAALVAAGGDAGRARAPGAGGRGGALRRAARGGASRRARASRPRCAGRGPARPWPSPRWLLSAAAIAAPARPVTGGARLPDAARSLQVAACPPRPSARRGGRRRRAARARAPCARDAAARARRLRRRCAP